MKTFQFGEGTDNNRVTVIVLEEAAEGYGLYVWPCAPVLAQYVWHHREVMPGKQVLELGAGTALPGVLAAMLGAQVTLSDAEHLPHCRESGINTCRHNQVTGVNTIGLTWGQYPPDLLNMTPVDLLLASDCFYDTKDFEDIFATVTYLLEQNTKAEFWTTYQERSVDRTLAPLLLKWGLRCREVPLGVFGADSHQVAGSDLPGDHTIRLLVISKVS